ncbi:MAG: hypothetical protein JWR80_2492 [Bradyrhizobium sp.]|nr:hypothetical protein [Bradyrhizobium sp.]
MDALRRSAKRAAIAVCAAVVLNLALVGIVFGTDPETKVALGLLATYCVASSVIIAGLLAGFMAYRTSLLMQDLARARGVAAPVRDRVVRVDVEATTVAA